MRALIVLCLCGLASPAWAASTSAPEGVRALEADLSFWLPKGYRRVDNKEKGLTFTAVQDGVLYSVVLVPVLQTQTKAQLVERLLTGRKAQAMVTGAQLLQADKPAALGQFQGFEYQMRTAGKRSLFFTGRAAPRDDGFWLIFTYIARAGSAAPQPLQDKFFGSFKRVMRPPKATKAEARP